MKELKKRATEWVFWFGFIAFLTASTPHIAAYFRHFDPNAFNTEDAAYWVISYGVAIAIDLTDMLITASLVEEIKKGRRKRELMGHIFFVCFIMLLSWFFNYQYNVEHQTDAFAKADAVVLIGTSLTLGSINPIVGSSFQFLIVSYSFMASSFSTPIKPKTAAEMEAEATEYEALSKAKKRMMDAKKGNREAQIEGMADTLEAARKRFGPKKQDLDALREQVLGYLRSVPSLLEVPEEENALRSITTRVQCNRKIAQTLLAECRALISKENAQKAIEEMEQKPDEDKLRKTVDFLLHFGEGISDESLANHLGLSRPASALFWKRKALFFIGENGGFLAMKRQRNIGGNGQESMEKTLTNGVGKPEGIMEETWQEMGEETPENMVGIRQRNAEEMAIEMGEETPRNRSGNGGGNAEEMGVETERDSGENVLLDAATLAMLARFPEAQLLLESEDASVTILDAALIFRCDESIIRTAAEKHEMAYVRGKESVRRESLIEWGKVRAMGRKKTRQLSLVSRQKAPTKPGRKVAVS